VNGHDAVWVAHEGRGVLEASHPSHAWPSGFDRFLLMHDQQPVAWVDPHGTSIDWLQ
jgi:hypothetical protein